MKKILQVDEQILLLLAVVFAPHVVRVPAWISVFCAFSWAGSLIMHRRHARPLPRTVVIMLAIGCTLGAMFSFAGSLGREAGVGLLSLMLALKPLETRTDRDRMVTVFLAYFLILTHLLYSQSLFIAGYMLVGVVLTAMVQIRINDPTGRVGRHCRKICTLLAQAAPLALVLFVFFPRISGGLWGLSDPKTTGVSGLSNSLSPGGISSLALSRAIAFRVSFEEDRIVPRQSLYWRVLVLSRFDGRQWMQGEAADMTEWDPEVANPVRYTVTAEPSNQPWMYGLDFPVKAPPAAILGQNLTVRAPARIDKRVRYPLVSCLDGKNRVVGNLKDMVALPPVGGEEARELAKTWRNAHDGDRAIVTAALSYFRDGDFHYSLNPPLLKMNDPVDDFLFNVRKGYCEHYASAFTFLMRAAGIPARVVVGYQGGEMNPVGEYLIVRQSDAHAWSEVWLGDEGWTRIDPTAAVSPLRIDQGAGAVAAREVGGIFEAPAMGAVRWVWNHVRLNWDALNTFWNEWVLDYSARRQDRLLAFFGLARTWKGISTGILLSLAAVLGFGAAFFLFQARTIRTRQDPVTLGYQRFVQQTRSWPNEEGLPPASYMSLLMDKIPERSEEIGTIRDLYVSLRYRPSGPEYDRDLRAFRERVRTFKRLKKR
jgi:transglutaminase-like putative cysteine protease